MFKTFAQMMVRESGAYFLGGALHQGTGKASGTQATGKSTFYQQRLRAKGDSNGVQFSESACVVSANSIQDAGCSDRQSHLSCHFSFLRRL